MHETMYSSQAIGNSIYYTISSLKFRNEVYDREDYTRELMYLFIDYDLLTEMSLQRMAKADKDFSDLTSLLGEASQLRLLTEQVSLHIVHSITCLIFAWELNNLIFFAISKTFPVFITKHIASFFATFKVLGTVDSALIKFMSFG